MINTSSTNQKKEPSDSCHVHGTHARKANLALIVMMLAGMALIVWHVWVYGPSSHLAKSEVVTGSFPLLLRLELWDLLIDKHGILAELWDIFPYFIAGVFLAGYIRTFKIAVKLQATLRRYGIMSVVLASFIGIITPLCACGTLTTAISLLFAGIPLAPVMALLVTSPLMSPSTYLLTLNDLGPEWTVIRTLAAFAMGIFAGLVTHFLRKYGFETKNVFIDGAIVRGDFHDEDYPDERLRCNCKQKFGNRVAVRTGNKLVIFLAKSSEMLWLVGKYVIVGVVIGAIIERYMPGDWLNSFFGRKDPLNVLWITLASVPVFLHQISASSIIYHIKSSLSGTLDSGSALALMIGGPVTAIPTLVMFWTLFKKKVFVLYLAVCLTGTVLITFSLQALFFVPGVDTGNSLFKGVSAVSGGSSTIIRKQGENVRIVMDPEEKPLIATYSNALGSEGGVIFDAGTARFQTENAVKLGNRSYMGNVAEWLEQNSSSPGKKNILIYNVSTGSNSRLLGINLFSSLSDQEMSIRVSDRREPPLLTAKLIYKSSQVWLFFARGAALTDPELKAVSDFSKNGGALLVVTEAPTEGDSDLAGVNRLAASFGVTFTGTAKRPDEIPVSVAAPLFSLASELLGKFLKLTHKA